MKWMAHMQNFACNLSRLFAAVTILVAGHLTAAEAQEVRGVKFGRTSLQEVRAIRGDPTSVGRTEDGLATYVRYGEFVFYFNSDSVAEFARYFPSGVMSRSDVEKVYGAALTETRQPDLTLRAVYADTMSVAYDRYDRVTFIEYSRRSTAEPRAGGLTLAQVNTLAQGWRFRLLTYLWMRCSVDERTSYATADSVLTAVTVDLWDRRAADDLKKSLDVVNGDVCPVVRRLAAEAAGM